MIQKDGARRKGGRESCLVILHAGRTRNANHLRGKRHLSEKGRKGGDGSGCVEEVEVHTIKSIA